MIRPATSGDVDRLVEIHHEAIRRLCVGAYPPEIIESWVNICSAESFRKSLEKHTLLVADLDSNPIGFAELVERNGEGIVNAVFVDPAAAGRGAGAALFRALETHARERGLTRLWLMSSYNAEPFYAKMGMIAVERTTVRLSNGTEMGCVKLEKFL